MEDATFSTKAGSYWGKPFSKLKVKVMTLDENGNQVKNADGTDAYTLTDSKVKRLPYAGKYQKFQTIEEVRAQGKQMSDDEVVTFRNAQNLAKAKAAALLAEVTKAGFVMPTAANDDSVQWKEAYDLYLVLYTKRFKDLSADEIRDKARAKATEETQVAAPAVDEDEEE